MLNSSMDASWRQAAPYDSGNWSWLPFVPPGVNDAGAVAEGGEGRQPVLDEAPDVMLDGPNSVNADGRMGTGLAGAQGGGAEGLRRRWMPEARVDADEGAQG